MIPPCPFCHERVHLVFGPALDYVKCRKCNAHATREAWNRRSGTEALVRALRELANAADAVGVRFFDTDTMEPEVAAMQEATQAARATLKEQEAQP